ncbi:MAG: hypothetical protein FD174_608 [Geobacteraceae bacterium]|nr:MAG: hypothetical protein FD174_608 [Geobacteraceae bacterium]
MLTCEETSDLLAQLHGSDFNGKPNGRFRIGRKMLALLAGRQNIEQPTVDQIKLWLAEKHNLLIIDMHDELAIIKCSLPRRYRKATYKVLEDVLGISYESDANDDDE